MKLKFGARVVAVHQVAEEWAVYKHGATMGAEPVRARAFVVETDPYDNELRLNVYALCIDIDGLATNAHDNDACVGVFPALTESHALVVAERQLAEDLA